MPLNAEKILGNPFQGKNLYDNFHPRIPGAIFRERKRKKGGSVRLGGEGNIYETESCCHQIIH